ncbi:MAG: hypothetical protein A3K19_01625 [Lentisphaerae bacterium RIFOXYB12_FULL_65_16]|nr:MAG: hypothetical protein A3K18_02840 [Lentisphaerae bacterium RIFOXYA12_64_32]OGV92850.1 MAG: hypothetical protein A3K19_01625 [Lentisphaerae bacterium RIFOXYB12_FULL_65_16]
MATKTRASKKMTKPASLVPRPWTPVTADTVGAGVNVGVWGRECRFDAQPFLTGLATAGQELLAAPMALVGTVAGQPLVWQKSGVMLHKCDADAAVLSGWLTNEHLNVSVTTRIEFDGMMRIDLVVTAHGTNTGTGRRDAPRLENLWLEVPLRSDLATLYTYWPVAATGVVQMGTLKNSGNVPESGFAVPFKPTLWLGWEEGGLAWFAESARGWFPASEDRVMEVVRRGDQTVLRLHLADAGIPPWQDRQDAWDAPLVPLTFTFGFQATPVKPIPVDFHEWRINHCGYIGASLADKGKRDEQLAEFERLGVKTLVIHEAWNPIQNYPEAHNSAVMSKELSDACHQRGMKLLLYFGYEFSTLAPEWPELWDKVLVKNPQGGIVGGWDRQPAQRDYIVCYNSEWQDRFIAKMQQFVEAHGIDGVYLDGTSIPWGCANTAHGCGYRKSDGTLEVTFPIFAVRRMMQSLYRIFEPRGGIVNAHQSSCCCIPALAFCHSYWNGEQLGGKFVMDLACFRAEFMGRNFGIPCDFLSPPQSLALTLIHDVRPRPNGGESLRTLAKVWDVMTRFDVGTAEWLPYWRNADCVAVQPGEVKVSLYLRRDTKSRTGKALVVVSNLSPDRAVEASVTLQPDALGFRHGMAKAVDTLSGAELPVAANGLALTLKPLEYRLVEVAG